MKVVLATEVYPPRAGGAGWSTRALALALRGAGHAVTVVTTSPGPEDLDGLTVRRLTARGRRRLTGPRDVAVEALDRNATLVGENVLKVTLGLLDRFPLQGHGSLVGVLEVDAEVAATGFGRLVCSRLARVSFSHPNFIK